MSQEATPKASTPRQLIAQALQSLEIEQTHNEQCLAETNHWLAHTGIDDPALVDLTHLPFVTIDNPDSRDLDQALVIERQADDGWRLRYALADASYYVRPGSALFQAALARGTSFYTPLFAVPMLPTALSEGLISLNPDVDRRALVFDMIIDRDGTVSRTQIERARIRSRAKLDYGGVQACLDNQTLGDDGDEQRGAPEHAGSGASYLASLRELKALGCCLIAASDRRGVIGFDRSESRITVQGEPPRFVAMRRERHDTERYNEQLSLICNMQGAEMLLAMSGVSDAVQAVFRVHEAPLRRQLNELRKTLDAFAEQQDAPDRWRWQQGQSLADYVDALPAERAEQHRVKAVQRQIMQAQRASNFVPDAGEHHALKAASYARFSSPMREVVGIYTHKELLEALGGHAFDNDHDETLREAVITSANRARQTQRKLDKAIEFAALSAQFSAELASGRSPPHAGTVLGLRSDRLYIGIDDMALDVKLYRRDLEEQFDTNYALTAVSAVPEDSRQPHWHLGDAVALTVRAFDAERQRFRFTITHAR